MIDQSEAPDFDSPAMGWQVDAMIDNGWETVAVSRDRDTAQQIFDAVLSYYGKRDKDQSGLSPGMVRVKPGRIGAPALLALTRITPGLKTGWGFFRHTSAFKLLDSEGLL